MPVARVKFRKLHAAQRSIYDGLTARTVLRCGRRFGKTELLETTFSKRAILGRKIGWFTPSYKLMRPTYTRLQRMLAPLIAHASKVESLIELHTGGSFEFWTLDNEDAGRSRDYDDAVIDEAGLVMEGLQVTVEQAIMPTLLDRGGTLTLAGTPKGIDVKNFFYKTCSDKSLGFKEFWAPTRDNPTLDPAGVATLQEKYPPLVYQQEFLAEFVDWSGEAFFSLDKWMVNNQPIEWPLRCDAVFAVADTAAKTKRTNDGTGVVYFALTQHAQYPLVILDYDYAQIEGNTLESWIPHVVLTKVKNLADQCGALRGSLGLFIEDKSTGIVLLQKGAALGWPVQAIESRLTGFGKVERAISVSRYHYQEKVKISRVAHDKIVAYKEESQNHLLTQVMGFRVGDNDQKDDDLLDCYTYGVAIGIGDSEGF